MKNLFFALLLLFIFEVSCKKKTVEPLYGTISSLQFDGKPMQRPGTNLQILGYLSTGTSCNLPNYGIQVSLRSFNDTLVEKISISYLKIGKLGVIPLYGTPQTNCDTIPSVYFTFVKGRDLLVADYSPMKKSDNYVNVQSFDDKTKEVKGKFKLTLINNSYTQYPKNFGYRDTIVFESGDFTVRLQ